MFLVYYLSSFPSPSPLDRFLSVEFSDVSQAAGVVPSTLCMINEYLLSK